MRIGIDIDDVITDTSFAMKDYVIKYDKDGEIQAHMVDVMRGDPSTPSVYKFCLDNYLKIFSEAVHNENIKSILFTSVVNKNLPTQIDRVNNWLELEEKINCM